MFTRYTGVETWYVGHGKMIKVDTWKLVDIPLLFVSSVGYLGWSCRPENHGMTNEPCIEPWIQMMSVTIKKTHK